MEVIEVKLSKNGRLMCPGKILRVFVWYVCSRPGRRPDTIYIAITLLFLLLTVMAEMMVGEEFGGGGGGRLLEWRRGVVREAGRCSVRRVRPDSWLVSISLSGRLDWMDDGAADCGRLGARRASPSLMQHLTQGRGPEWSPEVDGCLPFVKLCVCMCVFGSWPHYYLQVLSVMVGVGTYCNHFRLPLSLCHCQYASIYVSLLFIS